MHSGSASTLLFCSLPQGWVLSPILFILYAYDIKPLINRHSPHGHLYSDDTQTYGSRRPDDVEKFEQWAVSMSLCFEWSLTVYPKHWQDWSTLICYFASPFIATVATMLSLRIWVSCNIVEYSWSKYLPRSWPLYKVAFSSYYFSMFCHSTSAAQYLSIHDIVCLSDIKFVSRTDETRLWEGDIGWITFLSCVKASVITNADNLWAHLVQVGCTVLMYRFLRGVAPQYLADDIWLISKIPSTAEIISLVPQDLSVFVFVYYNLTAF